MKLMKIISLCFIFAICNIADADADVTEVYEEELFQNTSYPEMLLPVRQALADGNIDIAFKNNNKLENITELELLSYLENARLLQLSDKIDDSKKLYDKAILTIPKNTDDMHDKAKAILLDKDTYNYYDVKTKYYLPDYAITFLYIYQALNYLKSKDTINALESLNNMSLAQDWVDEQDILASGIKQLGNKYLDKNNIQTKTLGLNKFTVLNNMLEFTDKIPNAYANPIGDYLKALLIEKNSKNYQQALNSINNAREYTVGNVYLDKIAGEYQKAILSQTSPYSMGLGRITVLYEEGVVNSKLPTKVNLNLGDLGKLDFSFPYYSNQYDAPEPVKITLSDDSSKIIDTYTEILYDTNLYAAKSLVEQYSTIITRDVVIVSAKAYADKNAKGLGGLLGSRLKFEFSESDPRKADLRSWLILPSNIQLFEQQIDSGDYTIQVNNIRQKIKVEQGKNTLLWIVDIGKFKKVYYFVL